MSGIFHGAIQLLDALGGPAFAEPSHWWEGHFVKRHWRIEKGIDVLNGFL